MPSSTTTLGHSHSAFVIAEATEQIQAIGQVFPRVQFELRLRTPNERVQAEIHQLRLRVKFANEVLGEGRLRRRVRGHQRPTDADRGPHQP